MTASLTPKLLKTMQAEYVPAEWNGKNESRLNPLWDRVVVLPDYAATKSSGGVELPEDLVERMNMSAESGVIVALGADAFKKASYRPKPGTRVTFERYAGLVVFGVDGKEYRVMDDTCIGTELDRKVDGYKTKPLRSVT
jgi:co-chaperonin GroES (HSP10)